MDQTIDPFVLSSSMSPKRDKTYNLSKKIKGPRALALKNRIRRSAHFDTIKVTLKNEDIAIDYASTEESSSSSAYSKQIDDAIPMKPPTISNDQLTRSKFDAIQSWVDKINITSEMRKQDDVNCSIFSQISSIHGDVTRREVGVVNSTFVDGGKPARKMDEMFKKDEDVIDATDDDKSNNSTNSGVDRGNFSSDDVIDDSDKENISNKINGIINTLSTPKNNDTESLLNEIYGNSWHKNRDAVLTGPRGTQKPPERKCATETKSRKSITYKNPYLDSEKKKSSMLLKNLQNSRANSAKKPWSRLIENLCDSESSYDESPNNIQVSRNITRRKKELNKVKLNFDDSDDDDVGEQEAKPSKSKNAIGNVKHGTTDGKSKAKPDSFKKPATVNKVKPTYSLSDLSDLDDDNDLLSRITGRSKLMIDSSKKSGKARNRNVNVISDSSDDDSNKKNKARTNSSKKKTGRIRKFYLSDSDEDDDLLKKNIVTASDKFDCTIMDKTSDEGESDDDAVKDKKKIVCVSSDEDLNKIFDKLQKQTPLNKVQIKRPTTSTKRIQPRCSSTSSDYTSTSISSLERNFKTSLTLSKQPTTTKHLSFLASLSANVPDAKCDPSARIFRNSYKTNRKALLERLLHMYNEQIFDHCIPDDVLVEWSNRLTSTAGYCACKKRVRRDGTEERSVRFVLSGRILDRAERLRDTLVHEMCHAATWIVNKVSEGHGPLWKNWTYKAMKTFPELPPISTTHDYAIESKYTYRCTQCTYSFGRHVRTINLITTRCGRCRGKFEVLVNKTGKNGEVKSTPMTAKKEATGFALFVKNNYSTYKTPLLNHGEVMKTLSAKYKEFKSVETTKV